MHSLRNLNIVTAACATLGILVLAFYRFGPLTDNGIPEFLLLMLMFSELVTIAGVIGVVMALKLIRRDGPRMPILLSGVSCLLFAIAFAAFGFYIWQTHISA